MVKLMQFVTRIKIIAPVLLLLLAGCGGGHSTGHVAVVDLDKVAAAIGRDKTINERVQSYTKEQEKALTKLRDDSRAQIDKQQKQLPANASDEARQKVAVLTQNLELGLRQEIAKAQQGAGQLRTRLAVEFRNELEPVARRIATQRGMDIVMLKQNDMLYVDPQADITDAVIDDMQQSGKKPVPASEPAGKPDK
jgi:Skp family chaperone for outer membrane proteins